MRLAGAASCHAHKHTRLNNILVAETVREDPLQEALNADSADIEAATRALAHISTGKNQDSNRRFSNEFTSTDGDRSPVNDAHEHRVKCGRNPLMQS